MTVDTGIEKSEQNKQDLLPVYFTQIWALPWKHSLPPN